MPYIPSREAAKLLGLHPNTLRKYADQGRIKTIKTASGQRRYDADSYIQEAGHPTTICYCRVSSHAQRQDLQRQVAFMQDLYPGAEVITDIGGGLNFQRKGLVSLLERLHRGDKLRLVVANKDRLARFGFDLIRCHVEQNDGKIVVLDRNDHSPEQELTQDILAILHTFSTRLHGLRRYRNAIAEDPGLSVKRTAKDPQGLV